VTHQPRPDHTSASLGTQAPPTEPQESVPDGQHHPLTLAELYELQDPPTRFSVSPIIPMRGFTLLCGEADTGKTWTALSLAMATAAGQPWLGRFAASQGTALIIEAEMTAASIRDRFKMLHADSVLPISVLCTSDFSLDSPSDIRWLCQRSEPLVILDSLIRLHRLDENAAESGATLYRQAIRPILDSEKSVVAIHHAAKPQPNGSTDLKHRVRGTGDLVAMADSVLFMQRLDSRTVMLSHPKARLGPAAAAFIVEFDVTEGSVGLRHGGEATATQFDHTQTAREAILAELAAGHLTTGELEERLKATYGATMLRRALKTLSAEGAVACVKVGRRTVWSLTGIPDGDGAVRV
jgi:hypothetical protein